MMIPMPAPSNNAGRHFTCEQLGHRSLDVAGFAGVGKNAGLANQQPRRVDLHGHIRQHELDRLMFENRLAERDTLLCIAQCFLQPAAGEPDRHRGDGDPPSFQDFHGVRKTVIQFTAKLLLGDPNVVERQADRVRGAHTHLVFFRPDGEPRRVPFHDKRANAFGTTIRRRPGHHDIDAGVVTVGDPLLW